MSTGTNSQAAISLRDASVVRGGSIIWSQGSFTIPAGSVTAIVGTNGAGKTTMMKVELGLIPLAGGSIDVLGQPAGKATGLIGYVPQSYTSEVDANLTVEQAVLLGINGTRFGLSRLSQHEKDQARAAMRFTGVEDRAKSRLSQLSGGLRQRVAIAQALAGGPKLLMLDEPLANLDLASQRDIVDVLAKLNAELNMTIQVVAHDLNMLLPILDGAVYLLDGHPHYTGMHEMLDSQLLTHLYGTEVEVVTTPQGDIFITPGTNGKAVNSPNVHSPDELTHHSQAANKQGEHDDSFRL